MEITAITSDNKAAFKHLITADVWEMMEYYGHFAIGAAAGSRPKRNGAGIVCAHRAEDEDGPYIVIDWIYVRETYRRKGFGKAILKALKEEASDRGAGTICADLPPEGCPELAALFEAAGFKSAFMEAPVYEDRVGRLRGILKLPRGLDPEKESLISLDEADFSRMGRTIQTGFSEQYLSDKSSLLRYPREFFDGEASLVHETGEGDYDAFLLVHKKPSGGFVAVFYGEPDNARSTMLMAAVLAECLDTIFFRYGKKIPVEFHIDNEEAAGRIGLYLPGLAARTVRRYVTECEE